MFRSLQLRWRKAYGKDSPRALTTRIKRAETKLAETKLAKQFDDRRIIRQKFISFCQTAVCGTPRYANKSDEALLRQVEATELRRNRRG